MTEYLRLIESPTLCYQGIIFFSPFFFLLVDSFALSAVALLSGGFAFGSVEAVAPFAPPLAALASLPAPAAGALAASVFAAGGFSEVGAVAGAVPFVSPFVSPVAAGAAPPVS